MSQILTISSEEIFKHIKVSCQIPNLVEEIATKKIIAETAFKAGIEVKSEEIQQEGDQLRLEKQLIKAKDTWAWLKKHHLSMDEFEEFIYNNILHRKLANHLFAKQVEKFFYENQLNYVAAVTYEVVLDDRDLALELFYELQEREISFPEIARGYIQEPVSRRAFGYKGLRYRQDFRPEIAASVFAATPPQVIKPIVTPKGVHLIWVEEIIQPQLDKSLREQIIMDLFSVWLERQIKTAQIDIQLEVNINSHSSEELLIQA